MPAVYSFVELVDDAGVAGKLLEVGADVAAKDDAGRTALHFAAQDGRVEVARRLLDAGADVAAKDNAGHTPEDLARSGRYHQVYAGLLRERRHLAFAMGLHDRLGGGGGCLVHHLDLELVQMVMEAVDRE